LSIFDRKDLYLNYLLEYNCRYTDKSHRHILYMNFCCYRFHSLLGKIHKHHYLIRIPKNIQGKPGYYLLYILTYILEPKYYH